MISHEATALTCFNVA